LGVEAKKEVSRFVTIALGSANELEYLLLLATDLAYLDNPDLIAATTLVAKQLQRLRRAVQANI
jgi:four helix bundle protein